MPEAFLPERGLTNYWGYNTIGYFAPHAGYSAAVRAGHPGGQVAEFKAMVDALHAAGLEVLLDVVFNHTAEGDHTGPTLCHRGLDNEAYYRLDPDDPRRYVDTTGCGNSLDAGDPLALQMVMDSLRYWLIEMRVDGFRFDLAPTLARQYGSFDRVSAFLDLVSQDPVVSRAKLIAEPWDVGQVDSYGVGRFPLVAGVERQVPGHDARLLAQPRRSPRRVRHPPHRVLRPVRWRRAAAHLVGQHDHRARRLHTCRPGVLRSQAQRGQRRGQPRRLRRQPLVELRVEGPTTDAEILALRGRQSRALLATLLLSFGVPMIVGGDELGRTQQGNNNAYCQDNPTTWFDWSAVDEDLLAFTRRLVALRQAHPVFRRRRFLIGAEAAELLWFTPAGTPMTAAGWRDPDARSLALYLDGADAPDLAADGSPMLDDDFLLLVNAWWEPLDFTLPPTRPGQTWLRELDTSTPPEPSPQPQPAPPTRSPSDPAPSWCSEPRQQPNGAARRLEVRPAPGRRA